MEPLVQAVFLPGAVHDGAVGVQADHGVGHGDAVRAALLLVGEEEVGHPDVAEEAVVQGQARGVGVELGIGQPLIAPPLPHVDVHREVLGPVST